MWKYQEVGLTFGLADGSDIETNWKVLVVKSMLWPKGANSPTEEY